MVVCIIFFIHTQEGTDLQLKMVFSTQKRHSIIVFDSSNFHMIFWTFIKVFTPILVKQCITPLTSTQLALLFVSKQNSKGKKPPEFKIRGVSRRYLLSKVFSFVNAENALKTKCSLQFIVTAETTCQLCFTEVRSLCRRAPSIRAAVLKLLTNTVNTSEKPKPYTLIKKRWLIMYSTFKTYLCLVFGKLQQWKG